MDRRFGPEDVRFRESWLYPSVSRHTPTQSTLFSFKKAFRFQASPASACERHWNSRTTSLWPTNVCTGEGAGADRSKEFHRDKLCSPRRSCGTTAVTRPSPNGCKFSDEKGIFSKLWRRRFKRCNRSWVRFPRLAVGKRPFIHPRHSYGFPSETVHYRLFITSAPPSIAETLTGTTKVTVFVWGFLTEE